MKKFSLRDVSNRRRPKIKNGKRPKTENGSYLYFGIGGFPDFVVLPTTLTINNRGEERNFIRNKVLGAIEVKYVDYKLMDIDNSISDANKQIIGHILCFNKVIYTNGLMWKYYEYIPDDKQQKQIDILKEKVYNYSKDVLLESSNIVLLDKISNIQPKWSVKLGEVNNNEIKWKKGERENLLRNLQKCNW